MQDELPNVPTIGIDETAGVFSISGESYPEDVGVCFAGLADAVSRTLKGAPRAIELRFDLIYYNSSSAELIAVCESVEPIIPNLYGLAPIRASIARPRRSACRV